MKQYTEDKLHISQSDNDGDEPLAINTAVHSMAESILKENQCLQSAGERESTRTRLVQMGGPYRALARGSPISLWTVYRNSSQKTPSHRNGAKDKVSCGGAAVPDSDKQSGGRGSGCCSPKSPPRAERPSSVAAATPPTAPSERVPSSLPLSQAERCAVDLLALDSDGAAAMADWRLGEAELSPCAIYGGDSPQPSERKRSRDGTLRSSVSQGEAAPRHFQCADNYSSPVPQTCLASAVMRQYNERTRHRLAVECLAIPY